MKQAQLPGVGIERPRGRRRAIGPTARLGLLVGAGILIAYVLWPFAALWHLDRAVRTADMDALSDRIDLNAVRDELKRKLNKDSVSSIDTLSDPFIRWLEDGIQTMGSEAVERLVTLDWVRQRLLTSNATVTDAGFLGQITSAYFDAPGVLHLTIGRDTDHSVQIRMHLDGWSWRIKAVYY